MFFLCSKDYVPLSSQEVHAIMGKSSELIRHNNAAKSFLKKDATHLSWTPTRPLGNEIFLIFYAEHKISWGNGFIFCTKTKPSVSNK